MKLISLDNLRVQSARKSVLNTRSRVLAFMLTLCMLFSFAVPLAFADEPDLTITVDKSDLEYVKHGQEIEVPIVIENHKNVGFANITGLKISWDEDDLEYNNDEVYNPADPETWPFEFTYMPIPTVPYLALPLDNYAAPSGDLKEPGHIVFGGARTNDLVYDGTYVTLKFKVKDTAAENIKINIGFIESINFNTGDPESGGVKDFDGNGLVVAREGVTIPVVSPPVITTPTSLNFFTRQTVTGKLEATGTTPITWTKTDGPDWLNVAENGTLSGTAQAFEGSGILHVTAENEYFDAVSKSISVIVSPPPPVDVSVVPTSGSVTYGDALAQPKWEIGDKEEPGEITFSSSVPTVATVDGVGVITIVGAGITEITANAAGVIGKSSANSATYTLTVNKKDITISSVAITAKTYDGTQAILTSSVTPTFSDSGVGDNYMVDDAVFTDDADVGDSKPTTISVSLTGTANTNYTLTNSPYTAATANITARTITVTPNAASKVFGYPDPTFTFTTSGGPPAPLDATILAAISRAPGVNVGDYDYIVSSTGAGGNYTLTKVGTAQFSITKATLTPAPTASSTVRYNDVAAKTVDITALVSSYAISGDTLEYTVGTISPAGIIAVGASAADGTLTFSLEDNLPEATATATIHVTVSGFTNYTDITVNVTVNVTEKTPTSVTVTPPPNITYGATLADPTATAEDGGDNFIYIYRGTLANNQEYTPTNIKPSNPGEYTVTAVLESATHSGASNPSTKFTIAKKGLTWGPAGTANNKVYDGGTTATAATHPTLSGVEPADTVNVSNGTVTFASADVGTGIVITATGYGISGTHAWKYNTPGTQPTFGTADITAKALAISGAAHTKTYDETTTATGVTVTLTGFVNGEIQGGITTTTVTAAYTSATAGTTSINISDVAITGGVAGNYTVTVPSTQTVVGITKAAGQAITDLAVDDKTNNSITVSATAPTNGQTLQFALSSSTTPPAATAAAWVNATAGTHTFVGLTAGARYYVFARSAESANYNANVSSGIQVDTKRVPTASNLSYTIPTDHVYSGSAQGIGTVTGAAGMGAITVLYNGITTLPVNAGTYAVTADIADGTDFVAATGVSLGNYIIGKKDISITGATITAKIYDGTTTIPTSSVTPIFSDSSGVGSNYVVNSAAFTGNADVGTSKPTTITVTLEPLTALNYNLTNPTYTGATANITKASEAAVPQKVLVKAGTAHEYEFDLRTLLPHITAPMRLGTVSYTYVSTTGTILGTPSISDNTLTIPVLVSATAPDSATIRVNITSVNFEFSDLAVITVETTDSTPVVISGVSVTDRAYNGQAIQRNGTAVFTDVINDEVVTNLFEPTYTWSSGTAPTNAGTYTLTISAASVPGYDFQPVVIEFSILKRTVTVTADNKSINVNAALPEPTISYAGFVSPDNANTAFSTQPDAVHTAESTATAGIFPIIFAQWADLNTGVEANYTLNHVEGNLTITSSQPPSPSPDGPGGGGGGGGGEGGRIDNTPDTPSNTIPGSAEGSNETTNVSVTVNNDTGSVVINLDASTTEALIEKALAAAADDAADGEAAVPTVILDLSSLEGAESAVLNVAAAQNFSEAEVAITVILPDAEITLPVEALAAIAAFSGSGTTPVTVEAAVIPMSELRGMQAAQVKGYETVVSIDVFVGDTKVDVPLTVSLPYTLKPNENPDAVRVWYMDEAGALTDLKGTYDRATGMITFTINHQSYFVVGYDPVALWINIFSDVSEDAWYFDAVAYANFYELFGGYGDGLFGPGDSMTRAMFVQVLYNMEGQPALSAEGSPFSDVLEGAWYYDAVIWAAENGIVTGVGGGRFDPSRAISRQEMAVMLLNFAECKGIELPQHRDLPDFSDYAQIDAWAETAAKALAEAGVLSGSNNEFMPGDDATRAQVAAMFKNYLRFVVE